MIPQQGRRCLLLGVGVGRGRGRGKGGRPFSSRAVGPAQPPRATAIRKILVANRGEIACRIIRTATGLGLKTVAIYSQPDANALHVKMADEAVCVGPATAQHSYLNASAIIAAANHTQANAIHPGYGFLSENARFAEICEENGIIFIGPPANAIRTMGDKSASKRLVSSASVPVVPGYHGDEQSPAFLKDKADCIGYPVLIKATQGGGGKGMRIVSDPKDFFDCLESAQREANASFGDKRVLIEKYITRPRHIEVQLWCNFPHEKVLADVIIVKIARVFGDRHGNVVHLFERDCSVQRRHQKIIEEAPAPNISEEFRQRIGTAAVDAAKAVGYYNAGTVEFIVDVTSNEFYFMEMNTRLQVEHPVTEMVTKQDLVEWQIAVANGEAIPLQQKELNLSGHAFEARIYAENVGKGFLPASGVLHYYRPPLVGPSVRVETGVEEGDSVSVHYDPMISKLVVWGHSRQAALVKLHDCLSKFQIAGLPTNISFLKRLVKHNAFGAGEVETHFIEQFKDDLLGPYNGDGIAIGNDLMLCGALTSVFLCLAGENMHNRHMGSSKQGNPWNASSGYRMNHFYSSNVIFNWNPDLAETDIIPLNMWVKYRDIGCFDVEILNNTIRVRGVTFSAGNSEMKADVDGLQKRISVSQYRKESVNHVDVWIGDRHYHFTSDQVLSFMLDHPDELTASGGQGDKSTVGLDAGSVIAPMAGCITKIFVENRAKVSKGDPLLVMEAMKMEHTVRAHIDGLVQIADLQVGQQVKDASILLSIQA